MRFHELLADVKTQTKARRIGAVLAALELLKNTLLVGDGNACALVVHFNTRSFVARAEGDRYRLALSVADGVVQQVDDDLLDAELIPAACNFCIRLECDDGACGSRLAAYLGHGTLY